MSRRRHEASQAKGHARGHQPQPITIRLRRESSQSGQRHRSADTPLQQPHGRLIYDARVTDKGPQGTSGIRGPENPPPGSSALDAVIYYVDHFTSEVGRARGVAKRRARGAVLAVTVSTSLIAVVGAATAILGWTWLGIASAALAGVASVVGAWDGLFRHRDLWLQRTHVLSRLQELQRYVRTQTALDPPSFSPDELATIVLARLDRILNEDLEAWAGISRQQSPPAPTT